MNAKQRRKAKRSGCYTFDASRTIAISRDSILDDAIGVFVAPEPLYPCCECGKLTARGNGWMCDGCIPF